MAAESRAIFMLAMRFRPSPPITARSDAPGMFRVLCRESAVFDVVRHNEYRATSFCRFNFIADHNSLAS
jgi:hypothetical protein